ncbi:MAG: terminase large subunit [Corynebacterium sp.]|jgi:hypothetical protein|nr:terminase large subunit [Corynebacterium sp.]
MTTLLDCEAPAYPEWPTLEGRQEAHHLVCDEGDPREAQRALTFAARVSIAQMPWQADTTRGILALEPDGMLTHPTAAVIAPRQNGKTLSAADMRILFGLFLRGEKIVYSAQRWKTAESIFKRIKRIVESRPSLKSRVVRQTCSQGHASIELASGASADFITRSLDAGRGLDEVDLIVYDEAYNLKDAETAALSPTQLASKNPQTIYLSSAVNQEIHANGRVLSEIRHRALEAIRDGRRGLGLYFREHMAPAPPEGISEAERRALREDPATARLANPSFGVIQTDAKVRKLLTELGTKSFEVEVLGWGDWPPVDEGGVRVFDAAAWRARSDEVCPAELVRHHPGVIGVDRSPSSKVWAIGGAQYTRSGDVQVEIGWCGDGTPTEVAERLVDVITEADPAALVIDSRSPAAVLRPYLIKAGIEPVMTNTTELALYCEGFYEAFLAGHITHSGQQVLTDSVTTAVKRDLPGGRYAWGGSQIVQLMAVSLAHGGLLEYAATPRNTPLPLMERPETASTGTDSGEIDAMSVPF